MSGKKRVRGDIMPQVGITENGSPVFSIFKMVDGQGMPLDILLRCFEERKCIPSWPLFYKEALERGWNVRSTMSKIEQACADVYGAKHAKIVVERLNDIYNKDREGEPVQVG
jgi:hypothetical protein